MKLLRDVSKNKNTKSKQIN